jgi:AcrR family transcriptional regulator
MMAAMAIPGRDPRSRGVRRHDELLGRLVELFLREGFAQFSIEEMARRLRCSKSTIYLVATSKEQVIVAVVRDFFRRATERVEARLRAEDLTEVERIDAYLVAISEELAPASPAFFADVDGYAPAREIYRANTLAASRRVQQLVRDAVAGPAHRAEFLGAVAAHVMEAIHRGDIEAETGLADSGAYRALSELIVAAVAAPTPPPGDGGAEKPAADPIPLIPRSHR